MARDRPLRNGLPRPIRLGRHGRPPHHRRTGLSRTLDQEAFIGVLSHELRTPVTTIYGGAQILATKDLPDGRRRALAADVGQEAERLYRIVEDLVALLRSECGDLTPAREPVALGRLIAAAVDHELARNPDLRILYLGTSDAAADDADTGLLEHIVRNLLDNAVRYSAKGSPIEVIVDTEGDEVVVRVLDRGPGLSEPDRRDLIDPGVTPAALAGGGLGLFVAARLVHAMDGRSWARSRHGGGAEFGFALRRSGGGSSRPEPASSAAADWPPEWRGNGTR
jgi:two-component system sensor histidine kinase KdpD